MLSEKSLSVKYIGLLEII